MIEALLLLKKFWWAPIIVALCVGFYAERTAKTVYKIEKESAEQSAKTEKERADASDALLGSERKANGEAAAKLQSSLDAAQAATAKLLAAQRLSSDAFNRLSGEINHAAFKRTAQPIVDGVCLVSASGSTTFVMLYNRAATGSIATAPAGGAADASGVPARLDLSVPREPAAPAR